MKKITLRIKLSTCLLALLVLLVGCEKETVVHMFRAEMEVPADEEGSKTELINESMVYWQVGDKIDAWCVGGDTKVTLVFKGASSNPVALFESEDNNTNIKFGGSGNTFIALFPHDNGNSFNGGNAKVVFPAEQDYAGDNTFGTTACPMVAYGDYVDANGVVRLLFHNLCGIVRIQLRSTASTSGMKLKNIQFASDNDYLSGPFSVNGHDQYNPYVSAASGASKTVTISNINKEIGNDLLTFYLVLPAVAGGKNYHLSMRVNAQEGDGGQTYQITKVFTANVRRNSITKLPALTIKAWSSSTTDGGETSVGLAGNGTQNRPFLIYSAADLVLVRDAFNNQDESHSQINGVMLKQGTPSWFKIMRSDIVLGEGGTTWENGINGFRGNMIYGANQTSMPGIENNSGAPIFESIASDGIVDGLVVRGSYSGTGNASFSPLCNTNHGRITNCRLSDNATYELTTTSTEGVGMAGICVTNSSTGIISACGCRATLSATRVAGICLENSGKIVACYASSPMRAVHTTDNGTTYASQAAGICFKNSNMVKDCYFASNINMLYPTEWGGIVYRNIEGGNVTHCYVDASGIIQSTASIGGIVHKIEGGVIDNCWNDADLMNVQRSNAGGLGGIVYSMEGGEVRNSIRYRPTGSLTCTGSGVVGGFVARMSGGEVRNCAFYGDLTQSTVQVKGAFVGTISGGTIQNVYGYQTPIGPSTDFYGQKSGNPTFSFCYGQTEQNNDIIIPSSNESLLSQLNGNGGWTATSANTYMQWIDPNTGTSAANTAPPVINQKSYLPLSSQGTKHRRKSQIGH